VAGHAEAHTLLAELIELRNSRYVSAYDVALIHLALGEAGAAMEMLETAYAERAHSMAFMGVDPRLDLLRAEARFERLQARLRFPSSMTAIA
jgi:hypothetical protein